MFTNSCDETYNLFVQIKSWLFYWLVEFVCKHHRLLDSISFSFFVYRWNGECRFDTIYYTWTNKQISTMNSKHLIYAIQFIWRNLVFFEQIKANIIAVRRRPHDKCSSKVLVLVVDVWSGLVILFKIRSIVIWSTHISIIHSWFSYFSLKHFLL